MPALDQPILAWRNVLAGAAYSVTAGQDDTAAPLSNVWGDDITRPALPTTDANGNLIVTFTPTAAQAGSHAGQYPAGYGPAGRYSVDVLIIGAHRHEAAGFHWTGGNLRLDAGGAQVLAEQAFAPPANVSFLYKLAPHMPAATYTLRLTGLSASTQIAIPHLWLGPALAMPYVELGFDPYAEETVAVDFKSESGRVYRALRHKILRAKPRWRHLSGAPLTRHIQHMIELALEEYQPVWWAWAPDSRPYEVYRMTAKQVPGFPIRAAGFLRDLALDLEEAL